MPITVEQYRAATGHEPEQDDLVRCNCPHAGNIGHDLCGWSANHNKPNFMLPYFTVQHERAFC